MPSLGTETFLLRKGEGWFFSSTAVAQFCCCRNADSAVSRGRVGAENVVPLVGFCALMGRVIHHRSLDDDRKMAARVVWISIISRYKRPYGWSNWMASRHVPNNPPATMVCQRIPQIWFGLEMFLHLDPTSPFGWDETVAKYSYQNPGHHSIEWWVRRIGKSAEHIHDSKARTNATVPRFANGWLDDSISPERCKRRIEFSSLLTRSWNRRWRINGRSRRYREAPSFDQRVWRELGDRVGGGWRGTSASSTVPSRIRRVPNSAIRMACGAHDFRPMMCESTNGPPAGG